MKLYISNDKKSILVISIGYDMSHLTRQEGIKIKGLDLLTRYEETRLREV